MDQEIVVRLSFFFGVFALMAVWEFLAPRRARPIPRKDRWGTNLAILALDPLIVRLLFPVLPVSLALIAGEHHWGLLNTLDLPYWPAVMLGFILQDFTIYIQHVIFHAIPALWRLHMVHHADMDIDVTNGLRFHPIEIALSMGLKLAVISVFGPPALAVLAFEVALNATSMFCHSNVYLPPELDRIVRLFIVTPDMHRVHHSVIIRECNSNFGFNHPWWDRLFGTYLAQPAKGHDGMTIGLSQFRDPKRLTLPWLLAMPFIGDPGPQPINRH